MKYTVKLLTKKSGIVTLTISEGENLEKIEEQIRAEHGDFITLSSTEIHAN